MSKNHCPQNNINLFNKKVRKNFRLGHDKIILRNLRGIIQPIFGFM